MHAELQAKGHRVSRKRIARSTQADGLAARQRRRYVRTTDARHGHPVAAKVVARQFAPATIGAPDRARVNEITCVATQTALQCCPVILRSSREWIDYSRFFCFPAPLEQSTQIRRSNRKLS